MSSSDPRITFAAYKLQDVLEAQAVNPDPDFSHIVGHRDEVLTRYQPVFHPDHIPNLTKTEFESFLLFKNNHHWDSLHRVGRHMTKDMGLLREALQLLLDETIPIQDRLNQIRPERFWAANAMVSHLGMPVLTAILLIEFPDKYGVWNNTSDTGMKAVRLWKPQWDKEPAGDVYVEMNEIYLELAASLSTDLWTLDALWWVLKKKSVNK